MILLPPSADTPDAVADAYLQRRDPLEQAAVAVLHGQSLARAFMRLSRVAPAPVAWRLANVGIELQKTLDDNFPDVGEK